MAVVNLITQICSKSHAKKNIDKKFFLFFFWNEICIAEKNMPNANKITRKEKIFFGQISLTPKRELCDSISGNVPTNRQFFAFTKRGLSNARSNEYWTREP